jgi:hypothetical protein
MGSPGHEYYLVHWQDGRRTVFHPGNDALLHPKGTRRRAPARRRAVPPPKATRAPAGAADQRAPSREPPALSASPGDRLVIHGHHLGERARDGEIVEVLGDGGRPPYRVRWSDTGREALLYPGPDAVVDHYPRRQRRSSARA